MRFCTIVTLALALLLGCAKTLEDGETQMPTRPIEEVLKDHTNSLMAIPGVVGVGQSLCDGKDCIHVMVAKRTPELEKKVPKTIEGYAVELVETGVIRPLK